MARIHGQGTTLTLTGGPTFYITGLSLSGEGVEDIDITNLSTTALKEYVATTLVEGGELSLDVQVDVAQIDTVYAAYGTSYPYIIAWGGGSDTDTGNGYIKSFDRSASMDDIVTGTVTFKIDGDPTL